ncbi:MAG: hypothetical protein KIT09_18815 [Bryobacteraceae bacterium]|nr:hypothetical protein [Bryobacteraceae bacterium]
MEPLKYEKTSLRKAGLDERWLQDQIAGDPSILGLGELTLYRREHKQRAGGRLDILLTDPDNETMYEVEVMLGATDPSHIIRTIEYWDIETRRYPNREHKAVIVAEEITNRFFNVIWLLSRSIPIIAVQLDALKVDGRLLLHFTRVLDTYEPPEGPEEPTVVDRKWWEEQSSPEAMGVFDRLVALLSQSGVNVRFNQDAIYLSGKRNFARIIPKKGGYCQLRFFRLSEEERSEARLRIEAAGCEAEERSTHKLWIRLDGSTLDRIGPVLLDLVRRGVELEA